MTERPIRDLLERLSSEKVNAAWNEFLEQFSPLMMHVVRRFESDHGRAMDCFIYVCEALSDNGFQRLRRYRPDGPARFRTWLTAVVSNLCIDWRRREHGRFRPIQPVSGLPEFDQLVFNYIYVRGMPRDECLHALRTRFPEVTEQQLSETNARLFALLTPRQRWQLSARTGETIPLNVASPSGDLESALQAEEPGPDELAQAEQERRKLAAALAQLPPQQRLLLRLRYEQNLTLEVVARLMRLPDPFRANRQIQVALAALAEIMNP
jgi:RNA polymerase sigma factor (sigma-70 family)